MVAMGRVLLDAGSGRLLRYNYRIIGPARRGLLCMVPSVNVLYEDSGTFKVATVLTEGDNSVQVEAPHGKRTKIKSKDVLLRFSEPGAADLLAQAEAMAGGVDADFLWECCGVDEFGFADLAREYCGRSPSAVEAAGILVKLHSVPVYFYRKGRGRYRAAPPETLRAALAGIAKKKQQQAQAAAWAEQLANGVFPEEFRPMREQLLYKPDGNRPETKALDEACTRTGLSPAKLLERCGALPPSHDYHLNRFLYEHFPKGTGFDSQFEIAAVPDLPVAKVSAFSLDDAATTEIDDAFSLTYLPGGRFRVGIHIAIPALGFAPESPLGAVARAPGVLSLSRGACRGPRDRETGDPSGSRADRQQPAPPHRSSARFGFSRGSVAGGHSLFARPEHAVEVRACARRGARQVRQSGGAPRLQFHRRWKRRQRTRHDHRAPPRNASRQAHRRADDHREQHLGKTARRPRCGSHLPLAVDG